jgi:signal transduction histidine kinase
MFWHGVFPLLICVYAFADRAGQQPIPPDRRVVAGFAGGAVAILAVCALTLLATVGEGLLPAFMQGNRYTPAQPVVVGVTWLLSIVAFTALWLRKRRSVLDLWLMVVMCAWGFDVALSALLNAGRFDVGFYAGRIYGLLASSFVLMVLLFESNVLHGRLIAAHASERRERQLGEAKERELIAVNRELDSFSYSVSHDLRAPLRAVDGYARMLQEDYGAQLDAEGNRLLGVVRASSAQMARLIDDLLAFSRVGRAPLRTQAVDLDLLVQRVIEEQRQDNSGRALEFKVGELGTVEADAALLKHVLVNLIGNAVKFTGRKPAAVIEIGRAAPSAGDMSTYYVRDNGAGFEMKYYDKLFGVFQRLHGVKEFPGTGVGLAIVNRIVTRHGGRVWAESTVGEGATFFFTLPTASAA